MQSTLLANCFEQSRGDVPPLKQLAYLLHASTLFSCTYGIGRAMCDAEVYFVAINVVCDEVATA